MDRYPSILLSFVIAVVPIFGFGGWCGYVFFVSYFFICHIMSLMVVLLLNRDLYTYLVIRLLLLRMLILVLGFVILMILGYLMMRSLLRGFVRIFLRYFYLFWLLLIFYFGFLFQDLLSKYSKNSFRWLFTISSLNTIISKCAAYSCLGDSNTILRKASWRDGALFLKVMNGEL